LLTLLRQIGCGTLFYSGKMIARSLQKWKGETHMSRSETTQTTLGDLIVAVTDEVRPLMGKGTNTGVIVSLILHDLFRRRRVRLQKRSVRRGR
jgi:hypothetical protein